MVSNKVVQINPDVPSFLFRLPVRGLDTGRLTSQTAAGCPKGLRKPAPANAEKLWCQHRGCTCIAYFLPARSRLELFRWLNHDDASSCRTGIRTGRCTLRGIQVKYESIVLNPEKMFHMIYKFIEEDFDSKSVGFLEKPINTTPERESESSTDKLIPKWKTWKLHRRAFFQLSCGQIMKHLGYHNAHKIHPDVAL